MLMAPAVVFLPYSVPCGPRSTSIRSISEEIERRGGDAVVIDLVDIDADALLDAVIGQAQRRADAADVDRGVARILRKELHAGQKLV